MKTEEKRPQVRVGCGSWADDEYEGLLYPPGLPSRERLRAYAQRFPRVEVNSSYYRTPDRKTTRSWVEQTPAGFLFDLKLHRAFSANPAKAAAGPLMQRLLDAVPPLVEAKKLGVFLLTLAPSFGPDRHALNELQTLAAKLKPHPLAVEFRHRGWVAARALPATLEFFRQNGLVWVALDLPRLSAPALLPAIDEVTVPQFAYLRLHGRNRKYLQAKTAAERHAHAYSLPELRAIARRVRALARQAQSVHVTCNNHARDFAPRAALALQRLLPPRE